MHERASLRLLRAEPFVMARPKAGDEWSTRAPRWTWSWRVAKRAGAGKCPEAGPSTTMRSTTVLLSETMADEGSMEFTKNLRRNLRIVARAVLWVYKSRHQAVLHVNG